MAILRHGIRSFACFFLLIGQFGCAPEEGIRRYRVQKQSQPASTAQSELPHRLFAAIIPHGKRTWFLKVTGRAEVLDKEKEKFRSFVDSIRFPDGEESDPTWTLPPGWLAQPATGIRFATLQFGPRDKPFELSVTALPTPGGNANDYVLSNINRWRQQLRVPPITMVELPSFVEQFPLDASTITIASFRGHLADKKEMRRPAGMARAPAVRAGETAKTATEQTPPLTFVQPDGWAEGRVGDMRKAAFIVTDGAERAEITVIDLAAAAGDLLPNVNRWRKQIQMDETTEEQLAHDKKEIQVGPTQGDYFELVGPEDSDPRESILAVIVIDSGRAWFFKLQGSVPLVEREKQRFESFVQSVNFRSAERSENGE